MNLMIVAICLQQSQSTGPRRPAGKGSNNKGYGATKKSFSRQKGKARASSQRPSQSGGGRSNSGGSSRAVSNGSNAGKRKGAGLVRPITGLGRF